MGFEEIRFEENKIYSPVEIARKLALSKTTVYDWIKAGKLRAVRVGSRWRIMGRDINELIKFVGGDNEEG